MRLRKSSAVSELLEFMGFRRAPRRGPGPVTTDADGIPLQPPKELCALHERAYCRTCFSRSAPARRPAPYWEENGEM